jgi:hypothetical protein
VWECGECGGVWECVGVYGSVGVCVRVRVWEVAFRWTRCVLLSAFCPLSTAVFISLSLELSDGGRRCVLDAYNYSCNHYFVP